MPTTIFDDDAAAMQHALTLAARGIGSVEPNPAVGAVIVNERRELVADGFHERFGLPHAEVNAINAAVRLRGSDLRGTDLFVTLEPCSHFGKTPPCTDAVIAAGFRRVVVACQDPAPHVAGTGILRLREAGLNVDVGLCEAKAKRLIAPFRMVQLHGRPWVHAKWAMTIDGRIATSTGHSRWISCAQSRARVHELRGRMDAIVTGAGTVRMDDPLLTVRPPGPRVPIRVVLDPSGTSLTADSQMIRTASDSPVVVFVSQSTEMQVQDRLRSWGVEVIACPGDHTETGTTSGDRPAGAGSQISPRFVLADLHRRQVTNVLLEAGAGILGAFFDARLVDELHVFLAPKFVGGAAALSPIGGSGLTTVPSSANLCDVRWQSVGQDLLLEADVVW